MTKAEVNRVNSLHSTGPKTPAGKARAARNSVRHGAYSEALTTLLESPEDYAALHAGLVADLRPQGSIEENLVDRMASLWWRMNRAKLVANQALWMKYRERFITSVKQQASEIRYNQESPSGKILKPFLEAKHDDAEECRFLLAWEQEPQERLLRHEMSLERSFFKSLHELERIQDRRAGLPVAPVLTLDVNLNQQE